MCESPATQKQLAEDLGVNSGSLSKQMGRLEEAGLVQRRRSHAPYEVRFEGSLLRVLQTAAQLNEEIAAEQHASRVAHRKRVSRVAIRTIDDSVRRTP